MIRKILTGLFVMAFVFAVSYMAWYFRQDYMKSELQRVDIRVKGENTKLNAKTLKKALAVQPDSLLGTALSAIDLDQIRKDLESKDYIKSFDVYLTLDNQLIIEAEERKPMFRLVAREGNSLYIDADGFVFSAAGPVGGRVPIVNGYLNPLPNDIRNIQNSMPNHPVHEAYKIILNIRNSEFLLAQTSQLYLNSRGEWEFIPSLGNQIGLLGDGKHIESKLKKMELFYKYVIPDRGWDMYSKIDLRFKNQIVCIKE